ncbi:MAG: DUF4259 domain-containing protein [Lachnospiraceae bacterium]|nr:DUF4259 domain-containing protein [Lachnospiraceae bacterium]
MGSWGITAMESDAGLDALAAIREQIAEEGRLDAAQILHVFKKDAWNAPPDSIEGQAHTSPMMLAEVMKKIQEGEAGSLDYEWEKKKFSGLHSFTASRESLGWLRGYLTETLKNSREREAAKAVPDGKWGGWFQEKDWKSWQMHMESLIGYLDGVLEAPGETLELMPAREQRLCQMKMEG